MHSLPYLTLVFLYVPVNAQLQYMYTCIQCMYMWVFGGEGGRKWGGISRGKKWVIKCIEN